MPLAATARPVLPSPAMPKVTISIPHVDWREGKPRVMPSRHLRKAGKKAGPLKHPDGSWYSLDQAIAFSAGLSEELAGRRQAKAEGKRPPRLRPAPAGRTIGELIEALFRLPEFRIENDERKRRAGGLRSPKTIAWYRKLARVIETGHPELWISPAAAVSRTIAKGFLRELHASRGLSTARAVMALLSRTWSEFDEELKVNPWSKMKLPRLPARVRAGEIEEMELLIATADRLGRPEIGDAIVLGLFTGQRQNDRHRLTVASRLDGEIFFRQSKTGAVVVVPALPQLEARLAAARERRQAWPVTYPEVLCDERLRHPWSEDGTDYRHAFAEVRAAAAEACPSLSDFRDQDLRDTAVTWLARAGCTPIEIAAITGHTDGSVASILRHYLGRHPELARTAMRHLAAWLAEKGAMQ